MNITNTFTENGKTLQEVIEQFLIIFYNDYLEKKK